jgi:hypothetical protein
MKVFHYDPITGAYTGEGIARKSPMDEEYLIPANATTQEPPKPGPHEVVIFKDDSWQVIPDYRGEARWRPDGVQYVIDALGVAPAGEDLDHDPRPSLYHEWNGSAWVFDREAWLNKAIRPMRNQLLNDVDIVYCNAERWELLSPEQRQIWRAYKQALRDLPAIIDDKKPAWPEPPAAGILSSDSERISVLK